MSTPKRRSGSKSSTQSRVAIQPFSHHSSNNELSSSLTNVAMPVASEELDQHQYLSSDDQDSICSISEDQLRRNLEQRAATQTARASNYSLRASVRTVHTTNLQASSSQWQSDTSLPTAPSTTAQPFSEMQISSCTNSAAKTLKQSDAAKSDDAVETASLTSLSSTPSRKRVLNPAVLAVMEEIAATETKLRSTGKRSNINIRISEELQGKYTRAQIILYRNRLGYHDLLQSASENMTAETMPQQVHGPQINEPNNVFLTAPVEQPPFDEAHPKTLSQEGITGPWGEAIPYEEKPPPLLMSADYQYSKKSNPDGYDCALSANACDLCTFVAVNKTGLQLHRKRAHQEDYNRSKIELLPKRHRTTSEELDLIANEELAANKQGQRSFAINEYLSGIIKIPTNIISNIRNSAAYKSVLAAKNIQTTEQKEIVKDKKPTSPTTLEQFVENYRSKCSERGKRVIEAIRISHAQAKVIIEEVVNLETNLPQSKTKEHPPVPEKKKVHFENASSKSSDRRQTYFNVQNKWRWAERDAAAKILSGQLASPQHHVPREQLAEHWKGVFERQSFPDSRPINPSQPSWELERISEEDMALVLQTAHHSAPGPDGILLSTVRKHFRAADLAVIFNFCYETAWIPRQWRANRTILIPKTDEPGGPSDYRPITIGSTLKRLFHKALNNQLEPKIRLNPAQRGFARRDGTFENCHLLNAAIQASRQESRDLHLCLFDITKAFDSVCHDSILRALRNHGAPPSLISYISSLYAEQSTQIGDVAVKMMRGVHQGDPLSSILFNLVVDEALDNLKAPGISFQSKTRLPALGFADDIVLLSQSSIALQSNIDTLAATLRASGLEPNTRKCRTLSLVKQVRQKTMVVAPGHFQCDASPIPSVGVNDVFRYLGLTFDNRGRVKNGVELIKELLNCIDRAPLKPFQRLTLVRKYAIPRTIHQLVMGRTSMETLRRCDRAISQAIKKWLRLPHSTPNGYMHARLRDGGLGILNLTSWIPVLKRKRCEKLHHSNDIAIQALLTDNYKKTLVQEARLYSVDGHKLKDRQQVADFWARRLYRSVDGAGLANSCGVAGTCDVFTNKFRPLRGWEQVAIAQTRCGLLPTAERAHRWNKQAPSPMCSGGCRAVENVSHMIQGCYKSHSARLNRHDHLRRLIATNLERAGHTVQQEANLRIHGQLVKPDILYKTKSGQVNILDIQVRADNRSLQTQNEQKCAIYRRPDILQAAADKLSGTPGTVHAATINFKGVWCRRSVMDLRTAGVTMRTLQNCVVACLLGSFKCYKAAKSSTYRYRKSK